VLDHFGKNGTDLGVGLAGMRERMKELGGTLELQSGGNGTCLAAVAEVQSPPGAPRVYSFAI
jgi:signal transduction histidine kinase